MALSHVEQTETSRIFLHSLTKSTLQGDGFRFKLVKRGLLSNVLLLNFFMPERVQKPVEPAPWGPKQGDGGGPRSPDVSRPDTKDLLKKMRKVDPNQSKRYRQRTGQ
jgi:ubiquitin-like protein UBact